MPENTSVRIEFAKHSDKDGFSRRWFSDSRPIVIIILLLDVCLSDESVPREMAMEFLEVVGFYMF